MTSQGVGTKMKQYQHLITFFGTSLQY